jgi:hypothetical protein
MILHAKVFIINDYNLLNGGVLLGYCRGNCTVCASFHLFNKK